MSVTFQALRGDSLTIEVTLDMDGDPWATVADYDPRADLRRSAGDDYSTRGVPFAVDVDGNVLTLELAAAQMSMLAPDCYGWDIQFTDPATGAVFSWPPPSQPRNVIEVVADATWPAEVVS